MELKPLDKAFVKDMRAYHGERDAMKAVTIRFPRVVNGGCPKPGRELNICEWSLLRSSAGYFIPPGESRGDAMLARLVQISFLVVMAAATLGWLALIVSFIGKLAI
jgi:hypothetical protein